MTEDKDLSSETSVFLVTCVIHATAICCSPTQIPSPSPIFPMPLEQAKKEPYLSSQYPCQAAQKCLQL